jgi:hypothetical protein
MNAENCVEIVCENAKNGRNNEKNSKIAEKISGMLII